MPIYEWNCDPCDLDFEGLASVSEANSPRACPECGEPAGRIISACVISAGASPAPSADSQPAHAGHGAHGHHHGRGRSPIPVPARLCWMDDKSAERFAAYKGGRGHEYDDKQAAQADLRKQRGVPEPPPPNTTDSPVARALARKKAKDAAAAKAASAAPSTGAGSGPPAASS